MPPDRLEPLPPPPLTIACVGRKGEGKSELAYMLWDSWPGDRIALDTTGDFINGGGRVATHLEPDTVDLEVPPPSRWPEHLKEADQDRLSLRYVPDHSDKDYAEDMDRVVGLAFSHGDCLLVIEEMGLVAPAGGSKPHTRRALHMSRHQGLTIVETMPRTMDIDPLALSQCDVIYCFDLPNPDDRKRLADVIGWDRRQVDDAVAGLEPHGYLRFHAKAHELAICPPLPLPKRKTHGQRHMDQPAPEPVEAVEL